MTVPRFVGRAAPGPPPLAAAATTGPLRQPLLPWFLLALHLPFVAFAWTSWHSIATDGQGVLTDFGAWYSAGQIVRDHGGDRLYDLELQQQLQMAEGARLGHEAVLRPFVNPPHVAALMVPLAGMEGNRAFITWNLVNLALLGGLGLVTARILRDEAVGWRVAAATATAAAGCVTVALVEGSLSVVCAVGLVAFAAGVRADRAAWVAVGLALASVKPHFVVLPVVALLAQSRWRMLAWSVLAGAVTVAATVPLVGLTAWLRYPSALLHYGGPGSDAPEFARMWWTVAGALASIGGDGAAGLISPIGWVTFAVAVVGLAVVGRRVPRDDRRVTTALLALALVASIALAAHANAQDAVVVMVVLAMVRHAGLADPARRSGATLLAVMLAWPAFGVVAVVTKLSPFGTGLLVLALAATAVELHRLVAKASPAPLDARQRQPA